MSGDFSVEEHRQGGASVLTVSGELDLRTAPELERRLDEAFTSGAELVIVDLRQVEFMDSSGLRVMLTAHQRAQDSRRRFALVRGAEQVERVLQLTGVGDLLMVVETPDELLNADGPAGEDS